MATGSLMDNLGLMNQALQGTNTSIGLYGLNAAAQQLPNYYGGAQVYLQHALGTSTGEFGEVYAPAIQSEKVPPLKKLNSAIEKLRAEISAWHGDILERCPA